MIQLPKDILDENIYIKLRLSDMYGVILRSTSLFKDQNVLQTSHCLEIALSGHMQINYAGKIHQLFKNDIQFRKRGNYQLFPSSDYSSLLIFMESEFVLFFLKQHVSAYNKKKFTSDLCPFTFKTTEFIQANINQILDKITYQGSYATCIVKHSTHQILLQLLSRDASNIFVSFLRYLVSDSRVDLTYFMESNFTQNLTLNRLAKLTGRSLSAFKREFAEKFNTTPIKWQLNRRLEYADYLIKYTNDQISTIAYATGFENLSHFSKTYRQKFGISPTQASKQLPSGILN